MVLKRFGKLPSGKRLEKIKLSPNYRDGQFQNQSPTPNFTDGATFWSVFYKFIFEKRIQVKPQTNIPSTKTDLHTLDPAENVLVWFGHSSYFMQINGSKILVDPVLCGYASPFSFTTKAFPGTQQYHAEDIPEIDYLFLSHDHYDHLDYLSIKKLKPKIKSVITGLGNGAHLEHWGYDPEIIIEQDWDESIELPGFKVHTVPARHFSGRLFRRNQVLWVAFVLEFEHLKILIGGDSGYDNHFATIGNKYGPFDLVILENGQYNSSWNLIHLMPDQFVKAATDLKASRVMPVHSGKFALSNHPWNEPLNKLLRNTEALDITVLTPMIGEKLELDNKSQQLSRWWQGVS